jgi:hypothetical protein
MTPIVRLNLLKKRQISCYFRESNQDFLVIQSRVQLNLPTELLRLVWVFTHKFIDLFFGRSQRPRVLRRGSSATCLLGLRVRIQRGLGSLSVVSTVLSGRGLRYGPIPRQEQSYRV